MPMKEDIEYDGSFELGTSFTMRGNSSVFNHYYEYSKLFGCTPLHHLTLNLSKTVANVSYNVFLDELKAAFPEARVGIRNARLLALSDDLKDESEIDGSASHHELVLIEGTHVSIHTYRAFGSYFSVDIFLGTDEEFETFNGIVKRVAMAYRRNVTPPPNKFYMINHDGNNLDLIEYAVNREKFADFDIDRQYNDDFKEVSKHIESTLSKKDGTTGIALLHGCPGSGKTTYLRYLIATIPKRIIYMPPDLANQLGSPSFFNFIRQYSNSILVIEDGENILRKRMEGEASPAISNLLNLSDGIMGDALNIQVLCTFNADIAEIDEALLRPGRLIANHYFGPLSVDKTKALVTHLYGEDSEPKKAEMTVAEIYKMNDVAANQSPEKKKRKIGFLP